MSNNDLKICSSYDYYNECEVYEARIEIPCVDDYFLLEPLDYSTFQMMVSGYGADDREATDSLIKKLEENAKTLQTIADRLRVEKPTDSNNVQVEPLIDK